MDGITGVVTAEQLGPAGFEYARFKSYTPAEIVAYLPGIQRLTAHSIRFMGRDMIEVSRFIEFLNTYQAGLTP